MNLSDALKAEREEVARYGMRITLTDEGWRACDGSLCTTHENTPKGRFRLFNWMYWHMVVCAKEAGIHDDAMQAEAALWDSYTAQKEGRWPFH